MKRKLLLAVLVLALLPGAGCVDVQDPHTSYVAHNHNADYMPWWAAEDLPRGGGSAKLKGSYTGDLNTVQAALYMLGYLIFGNW